MELEAHHQDKKDAILTKRLHGNSGKTQGLLAMRKDFKTHKVVLDGYFKYFGKSVLEEDRQGQEKVRQYSSQTGEESELTGSCRDDKRSMQPWSSCTFSDLQPPSHSLILCYKNIDSS